VIVSSYCQLLYGDDLLLDFDL